MPLPLSQGFFKAYFNFFKFLIPFPPSRGDTAEFFGKKLSRYPRSCLQDFSSVNPRVCLAKVPFLA